jgi:hypothetical protein
VKNENVRVEKGFIQVPVAYLHGRGTQANSPVETSIPRRLVQTKNKEWFYEYYG